LSVGSPRPNVEVRDFEQVVEGVFVGSYRVWQINV
jgi:hypothetical protein